MSAIKKLELSIDRALHFVANHKRCWPGVAIVLAYLLGCFFLHRSADVDLFTRVATGRLIEIIGGPPTADPFAYGPKSPWIDHPWLASYLIYKVAMLGGDAALFLFKCAVALVTVVLLVRAQRVQSGQDNPILGYLVLFACAPDLAGIWISTVRAKVMGFLILAVLLLGFVKIDRQSSYRWFLWTPLLVSLWANFHGSYVIGLGFLFIFTLSSLARHRERDRIFIIITSLASLIAPLTTPYGLHYLEFSWMQVSHRPYEIVEWQSVSMLEVSGLYRYLLFLMFLIGGVLGGWRRVPLEGLGFILVGALWGFHHERITPVMSMAIVVYGPALLEPITRYMTPDRISFILRGTFIASVLMACWGVSYAGSLTYRNGLTLDYTKYPTEVVEWLWNHYEGGRVLTHYNDGGFALWRLYPHFQISFDGRYDGLYPPEARELGFASFTPGHPRQQEALEKLWPDFILLGPDVPDGCSEQSTLRASLFPTFNVVFRHKNFCILIHPKSPQPRRYPISGMRNMWSPSF